MTTADYEREAEAIRNGPADPVKPPRQVRRDGDGFRPKLYTSREFFAAKFPREWYVTYVLVKHQPGVFGGPRKSLKTNLLLDFAFSLGTATPFLNKFNVPKRARVLLLSGESGEATLQETGLRIAKAKGIDHNEADVVWGSDLPQLSNPDHLNDLGNILADNKIEVAIFDPLYLCLLAGADHDKAEASNYYQMGPLFRQIAQACLSVGTTPILTPHAKKSRATDEPLELDDLAFAGIAEFTRQWVLVNRREKFRGDGQHKLHLSIGGSAGQSFFGMLDVDEGRLAEDFSGRVWTVSVKSGPEERRERQVEKTSQQTELKRQDESVVAALIDQMNKDKDGKPTLAATLTRIRNGSGISESRTDSALERLRLAKLFQPIRGMALTGNGGKQKAEVWTRTPEE